MSKWPPPTSSILIASCECQNLQAHFLIVCPRNFSAFFLILSEPFVYFILKNRKAWTLITLSIILTESQWYEKCECERSIVFLNSYHDSNRKQCCNCSRRLQETNGSITTTFPSFTTTTTTTTKCQIMDFVLPIDNWRRQSYQSLSEYWERFRSFSRKDFRN